MKKELLAIHDRFIQLMREQPAILGAWYFGSASRDEADEHSDMDVVFLVAGEWYDDASNHVTAWLGTCCDRVILCWPEGFNGEAIVNNGYLLELNGEVVVYDVFLLNRDRLDDGICRIHYTDLQRKNVIFDKDDAVQSLIAHAPSGDIWRDDVPRLIDTYWYHVHLSAKYLVRRDFFKLEAVLRTMMDAHASLLLTALDTIPWGGSANKLRLLPDQYQQHLMRYGCVDDFTLMRQRLLQSIRWFNEDVLATALAESGAYERSVSSAILPRWIHATETLSR